MKLGIIGATGKAGTAVYAEAVKRGHDVTAIVRDPQKARELLGGDVVVLHKHAFALGHEDLTSLRRRRQRVQCRCQSRRTGMWISRRGSSVFCGKQQRRGCSSSSGLAA